MRSLLRRAMAVCAMALFFCPLPAMSGDAASGEVLSGKLRCGECHDSPAARAGQFPSLAGQRQDYLVKQLRDFRDGRRRNDMMFILARNLEEQDIQDLAAWFSGLESRKGDRLGTPPAGLALFRDGDPVRGIPACASCHDANLPGVPAIAGQHAAYLRKQLLDWRSGERGEAAADPMKAVAGRLSDAEIDALSTYLSGL